MPSLCCSSPAAARPAMVSGSGSASARASSSSAPDRSTARFVGGLTRS